MENPIYSKVDRLLTVSEIAERLAMSPSYVYQLIQTHELSAVIMGSSKRVRLEDVDSYIIEKLSPAHRG